MRHCVRSICLHVCKHGVDRNALPGCSEFRPSRDAVQINREGLSGQVTKRLPVSSPQNILAVVDHKFPLVEWDVWRRSCGQNREDSIEVLPWGEVCISRVWSTGIAS